MPTPETPTTNIDRPTGNYGTHLVPYFGMYAGPNYAGGRQWANNEMPNKEAWNVKPVNFLDDVTRNHDKNYTFAEQMFDKNSPAYKQALWQADKEMLINALSFKPAPGDWLTASYRDALIRGFAAKAVKDYGIDINAEWTELGKLDPNYAKPKYTTMGEVVFGAPGLLNSGADYTVTGMERLSTSGVNVQAALLFNQHIDPKKIERANATGPDGLPLPEWQATNRVVIPQREGNTDIFTATVEINGQWVKMTYNNSTGFFAREVWSGGQRLARDEYIPVVDSDGHVVKDAYDQRDYTVTRTAYENGEPAKTETTSVSKPVSPALVASDHLEKMAAPLVETGDPSVFKAVDPIQVIDYLLGKDPKLQRPEAPSVDGIQDLPATAPPIAGVEVPYTLPNGSTGTAWVTPDRPALISDEDGHSYQIDHLGNLTLPSDTLPGDGRITPVSYQPGDSAPAPAVDASPTPPQAPPAPLYDPNSLFLGNLGADNPYVCRPDDPPLDPDSQAPAPVETATPRPVGIDPGVAAVGSMANLILAIQNGNDLSAVLAGIGLVNNFDKVLGGAGDVIPAELGNGLGAVAGGLNLVNALENGDAGGILVSGIGLINTLGNDAATKFISGALGNAAGEMVPYLGVINSLAHGDPIGAVAGYLMTNPATFVFGAILSVFSAMGVFADEPDIPVAVGNAAAHWDEAGGVAIATTYDEAGGGSTANAWLNNLVQSLQAGLAGRIDESGRPLLYGLDPTRLPGIGYAFDADTSDGYLRLIWTDADGTPQWRQYDTSGMRNDGQSVAGVNDLARDFFLHAGDAILPAWEADTRFQQGGDATAPAALFTGAVSADGASIARTVLSLGAGATATTLLDLDGDGYLESTQWTASPLLAIDLNGDGRVSAFELVDGRAGGDARNSLARLDANGDGVLDAGDPAFAALALWSDINGNGVADDGESRSLAEAGIASLGYADDAVTVGHADGRFMGGEADLTVVSDPPDIVAGEPGGETIRVRQINNCHIARGNPSRYAAGLPIRGRRYANALRERRSIDSAAGQRWSNWRMNPAKTLIGTGETVNRHLSLMP